MLEIFFPQPTATREQSFSAKRPIRGAAGWVHPSHNEGTLGTRSPLAMFCSARVGALLSTRPSLRLLLRARAI